MYNSEHILNHFPSHVFWDAQAEKLDIEANAQYIIEKVMISCADLKDFNEAIEKLEKLYSKEELKYTIVSSKEFISKQKFYAKKRYGLIPENV
jgi:hypothetical protein